MIPSGLFIIKIHEEIEGLWHEGEVRVGYKDAIFEPSSALCHATELHSILITRISNKSILFLYTDEGPDHHLIFFSIHLPLVALFQNLNHVLLVVRRTAPQSLMVEFGGQNNECDHPCPSVHHHDAKRRELRV